MTPSDVAAGDISHYRILGPLGRGAMGEVYRAVDQRLGREVALKMLPRDVEGDADWQTRLLREAQAVSSLNHPGIVTLFDITAADGRSFLVMELVLGEPFAAVARRGVAWRRALTLVADVADALAAAHTLGILHRDIKSDNLMVTPAGQVKVLDFGLAKLRAGPAGAATPGATELALSIVSTEALPDLSEHVSLEATIAPTLAVGSTPSSSTTSLAEHLPPPASPSQPTWRPAQRELASDLTQAGQLVGTPAYMAPECYDGITDVRSEVFALGVVLYELLVGTRPFDRGNAFATMAAIKLDDPVAPSIAAATRGIPTRVDRVVVRALAKAAEDRFPDMATLAATLRELARPPRRAWWPWALLGAGVAVGAAGLGWRLTAAPDRPPAREMEVTSSRRLTLDQGCEEYPRFTPDGTSIIYDGLIDGDSEILSVGLDGSGRRRLTHAPGWDYAAAVSPDGARVAYIHEGTDGRTARVMSAAGDAAGARELGPISGYPAWTRDGALLVGDAAGRILRWELATGAGAAVARETVLGQLPTGARAYHLAAVEGGGVAILWWTPSNADGTGLGELDPGGRLRVIEQGQVDYEGGLVPSFTERGYYATRKAATTGNQLLWRPWGGGAPVVVPGGLSPRAGVDISRDARRLVFSTCTARQYIARVRPGVAPVVISRGEWQDHSPIALAGNRALITSDRLGHQQGWLIDLATREARAVTPPDSHGAAAAPGGDQVAYAADGGRGGLRLVALTGGAPRPLTTDASDTAPAFSHAGDQVVFVRTLVGQPWLHAVATDGGAPRRLVAGTEPALSPVADTIVYITAADAAGAGQIRLTDLAGGPSRSLPGVDRAAWQRPRFSPDGRRLLVLRGFQEVVELTIDGSAPPTVVWTATTDSVIAVDYTADGDGILAALADYDGDVWLAEGRFGR